MCPPYDRYKWRIPNPYKWQEINWQGYNFGRLPLNFQNLYKLNLAGYAKKTAVVKLKVLENHNSPHL